jgi:hypothetical protein
MSCSRSIKITLKIDPAADAGRVLYSLQGRYSAPMASLLFGGRLRILYCDYPINISILAEPASLFRSLVKAVQSKRA